MTGPLPDPDPLNPYGRDSLALWFGETKTGTLLAEARALVALSCSDDIDPDRVTLRATIPIHHDDYAGMNMRSLTNPAVRFAAVIHTESNRVWWAGPIWGRRYTSSTGLLEISASGMWSMMERRPAMTDVSLSYQNTAADIHLTGLSLRGIAARLVRYSMVNDDDTRADGQLPITTGGFETETGTAERHYYAYDLATIGERLRELRSVQNGPDMHFRPNVGAGKVSWAFRVGNPISGRSPDPYVWESGRNMLDHSTDEDVGRMVSHVAVPGDGSQRSKLIGSAVTYNMIQRGWPYTWAVVNDHSSVKNLSTLGLHGAAYTQEYGEPVMTWTVTVKAFDTTGLGLIAPLDPVRLVFHDEPWARAYGVVWGYMLGWSYDGGDTARITVIDIHSVPS